MSNLEQRKIPMMVELFYEPHFEVDEIEPGHREFCLELLQNAGYTCIAGSVGANSATVGELDKDARADCIGVTDTADRARFVTGPSPITETGIGVWTVTA